MAKYEPWDLFVVLNEALVISQEIGQVNFLSFVTKIKFVVGLYEFIYDIILFSKNQYNNHIFNFIFKTTIIIIASENMVNITDVLSTELDNVT